jgi:hypothetical protein
MTMNCTLKQKIISFEKVQASFIEIKVGVKENEWYLYTVMQGLITKHFYFIFPYFFQPIYFM